ncbi:DNA helicase B [Mixophyes fleayi]|uniref:DNA helicase B n=1 Tax=Mixophyes fleayi TaxID=3061075 RepID=UPI003F4DFC80
MLGGCLESKMSSRQERLQELKRRRRGADWIKLQGRLLPVKDDAAEAEDSDMEDDVEQPEVSDPEFLDADEIEGGAQQVNSWAPQNSKVKIETKDSKEYLVKGFFLLVDPWWSVIVDVKQSGSQYFAKGHPSYILEDDILGRESILPLFLKECNMPDEHKKAFLDWLPQSPSVTFSRLKELAAKFTVECKINILIHMENSSSGAFVLKLLKTPLVLRYLPKLLPNKVRSLLMLESHEQKPYKNTPPNVLSALERMLATEPWKLGFGKMVYQELQLCGCEATWDNFLQCDDLLEQIPDLQINALIVYSELKKKCMELGDTYVELQDLTKAVSRDMSAVEAAWEAIKFLKDNEIVIVEQQRVFLYNLYWYEVNIADYIKKMIMKKPWNMDIDENDVFGIARPSREEQKEADTHVSNGNPIYGHGDASVEQIKMAKLPDSTSASEPTYSTKLDVDQQKAVKMILSNPVTIISGKGGCGKTTVVSQVFMSMMKKDNDEIKESCLAFEGDLDASEEWTCGAMTSEVEEKCYLNTLLTAPTGKAASILKKKTGLLAATLHQVTCSYSAWLKQEPNEHKKAWKFSTVESLVVDEGSLVSVCIFSAVLKLLYKHARLAKLVILGDVRQLPSIEPGNFLADMFAALTRMNWTVELRTNHRAESQLIVDNATRISQQNNVDFDSVVYIKGDSSTEMPSEDKKFILVSLASEFDLCTAIKTLLQNGPGLEDHMHSQFIAFRRKDCLLINELCCKHYSGHTIKNHRNRFEFQCRDKVCCTKNAYVKELLTKLRHSSTERNKPLSIETVGLSQIQPEKNCSGLGSADHSTEAQDKQELDENERLCNGELFFIDEDVERDGIRELTLFDGEDRTYTLNYKALRSRSGLQHAWARTIHTFQGSEEDTVVYVLGATGRQNWKHVYTAVTRGRKRVYIIAKGCQLDQAVANKSRERKTRLQKRLKDVLPQSRAYPQPNASPPTKPKNTQGAEEEPSVIPASHELSYTQLKSPPRFKYPPVPTTPKAASPKGDCADHTISPGLSQQCDEGAAVAKRTGSSTGDAETPPKISRVDNFMDLAEVSPTNDTKLQNLSLHSPCHKELFKSKEWKVAKQ